MATLADWQVVDNATTEQVYPVLARDPVWTGYCIGDLVPPFRQYARFALAARVGSAPVAACMFFEHPGFTMLVPGGEPAGIAALLAAVPLPEHTLYALRDELVAAFAGVYALGAERERMARMVVTPATFRQPARQDSIRRIAPTDTAAVLDLYATVGGGFAQYWLDCGPFYGIWRDGELVAIAGTHVFAPEFGIGAVGGVLTREDARGHGFATAVTAAVTDAMLQAGCTTVILNVNAANAPALHVYTKLGYAEHGQFWEGDATRIRNDAGTAP